MAFKAINDTTGPDGLVPTLLVYGALSRMVEYNTLLPTVAQRSAALKKAITEIQRLQAKRQVNDTLNTRNGPSTTNIHELILNSDILVWYEDNTGQSGNWEGLYKLIVINGKSYILVLLYGNIIFHLISVKSFNIPDIEIKINLLELEYNSQETKSKKDIIIINTLFIIPLKYNKD